MGNEDNGIIRIGWLYWEGLYCWDYQEVFYSIFRAREPSQKSKGRNPQTGESIEIAASKIKSAQC